MEELNETVVSLSVWTQPKIICEGKKLHAVTPLYNQCFRSSSVFSNKSKLIILCQFHDY